MHKSRGRPCFQKQKQKKKQGKKKRVLSAPG